MLNYKELINNDEILREIILIYVTKQPHILISAVISRLREEGKTYEEIGTIFKRHRSQIFQIERGTFFPKKQATIDSLMETAISLLKTT